MGIEITVARGCAPTGRQLTEMLRAGGVAFAPPTDARVSWGCNFQNPQIPTLNANAGGANKLLQLERLSTAGVQTVPFFRHPLRNDAPQQELRYPALARRIQHVGGNDVRICNNLQEATYFLRNGWDFLSPVVPSQTEFRVWVYRRRHLASYEKVLAHPEWRRRYRRVRQFGRSYRLGWTTRLVPAEQVNRLAVDIAIRAVDVLQLDFGAVDVLLGTDGQPYVLEVNTGPGATDGSQFALAALADKIMNWVVGGYKRRNGETNVLRTRP